MKRVTLAGPRVTSQTTTASLMRITRFSSTMRRSGTTMHSKVEVMWAAHSTVCSPAHSSPAQVHVSTAINVLTWCISTLVVYFSTLWRARDIHRLFLVSPAVLKILSQTVVKIPLTKVLKILSLWLLQHLKTKALMRRHHFWKLAKVHKQKH